MNYPYIANILYYIVLIIIFKELKILNFEY